MELIKIGPIKTSGRSKLAIVEEFEALYPNIFLELEQSKAVEKPSKIHAKLCKCMNCFESYWANQQNEDIFNDSTKILD